MDDMHAFEQQLAARLEHKAGPRRPVDAMAIAHAVATEAAAGRWSLVTRRFRDSGLSTRTARGNSAFSAVKLVAAVAIVALFGGFLLTGILTTSPTDESAPAAVTASPTPPTTEQDGDSRIRAYPRGTLRCPPQMVGENRDTPAGWMRSSSSGREPDPDMLGGNTVDCTAEMDDPRLTGDADIDLYWRCDEGFSDCVYWADQQIDGPDGSWVGNLTGVRDVELPSSRDDGPPAMLAGVVTLEGTRAYEGLTFIGHLITDMFEDTRLNGVVYEGPPPPIPGEGQLLLKGVEYLDLPDELALADTTSGPPAKDERAPGDDYASGVLICPQLVPEPGWEHGWIRSWSPGGNPVDCSAKMDDPRLTGDADVDFNWQCGGGGGSSACVVWGTQQIVGPDGSWAGTLTGVEDYDLPWPWPAWPYGQSEAEAHMVGAVVVLEGSDGYAGLTFVGHLITDLVESSTLSGVVYEGPPPPLPGVRLSPTFGDIEAGQE